MFVCIRPDRNIKVTKCLFLFLSTVPSDSSYASKMLCVGYLEPRPDRHEHWARSVFVPRAAIRQVELAAWKHSTQIWAAMPTFVTAGPACMIATLSMGNLPVMLWPCREPQDLPFL